jgi:hypothetical protein
MPVKSKAQRRKFAELLVEGKISPEVYERWNREAGSAELPERLHPKAGAQAKRRTSAPKRRPKPKNARARKPRRTARRRH